MSTPSPRTARLFPLALTCIGILWAGWAHAAAERHWVGGPGAWNDRAHWAASANGPGGESVPDARDAVFIAPQGGVLAIAMDRTADVGDLRVDATQGAVRLEGPAGTLRVAGSLVLRGSVAWPWPAAVEMTAAQGVATVDTRGIPLGGDIRFTGGGTWSMLSDLVLGDAALADLRAGTLVTNGNMLRAGALHVARRGAKLMAGSSVLLLGQPPVVDNAQDGVDAGSSRLIVGDAPWPWGDPHGGQGGGRAMNVCATAVGQTPFTIDAQLLSNYNGFGVSCHGVCNGQVQVAVSGGVGPFTYSWVGGPTTALWNNACPGNQIVIVTDQGQGVSCATTVQVTDPALLSVIFTGTVPPTCAGVCNGSSTVFAVGGVPGYNYSWNNGAGTGASFNALCPGSNTLHVTDANNCAFDTTFTYSIQPIQPHLATTDVHCAGACDGTASVAPAGGTGSFTYDWAPGDPPGDGSAAVTGLCAGNYTVTIRDANGCDTTLQFQIAEPQPLLPNASHTDASCGSTCDGTATVAPTGGSGDYAFSWSPAPPAGDGTATASGLCAGTYAVTITDNVSGCDTVVAITIDAPPTINPAPTSTDVSCGNSCDGTASAPATGGSGTLTYVWTPAVTGQGTPNASQLCAGSYSLTITDAGGCDTTVQFTIAPPPPIVPQPAHTDVSCAGACDGTASAPATGGSGALSYDWQPGNPAGDGTANVSGLCAGNWTVTISDANGCDTTLQFTIAAPPELTLTGTKTNVSCGGTCDGSATVAAAGGTPGYTYLWTPEPPAGQGTATASQLCAGTWSVTVTDAHGCQKVRTVNILAPQPLGVFLSLTPASCPDACDGSAQAVVDGGMPLYDYLWAPEPASGQGSAGVSGLCPGAGTLTVTDARGCDTTVAFTIDAPAPIVVAATTADASCSGSCDGSITLAPSGGNGTFTYAWTPPSAGTGASATGLCPGTYQVVVASGACDTTLSFTIGQPPPIDVALAATPATCFNACDGSADLGGSLASLSFHWTPEPGSGQGTAHAAGLCAGDAEVRVTDANGCDTLIAFTITAPPALSVDLQATDASCGTACDGTATANASGGAGSGYTYTWNPAPGTGQGTATAGGLCPGSYSLTVSDGAGCDTTLQFTIARPAGIQAAGTASPASCASACDGGITAAATGGVAPYTWAWSPEPGTGQGSPSVGGLCPGTWTVTIGDQAGCDTTLSFTIDAPAPIDPHGTFTSESCNGPCDGTASVSPSGGSGAYSYLWSPAPPSGQGTGSVAGLCAGDWCVTITDAAGCDTTWCFTIAPFAPIQASVFAVGGPCWNECAGEATVTASGGAGGFAYQWDPEPATGQGTASATGLCEGPGTVTVTDQAGCDTTLAFIIFKNPPILPNLSVHPESCGGPCTGEAAVAPVGGSGEFTYFWQPEPAGGQGTSVASGLCAGVNYTVTIADSAGCDTIVPFTVPAFVPLAPQLSTSAASCWNGCDGQAAITGTTGGLPPYSYFWEPAPANGQGDSLATGLCPGDYLVHVADASGCDTAISFTITAPDTIRADAVLTPLACGGQCTGAIDLTASGGSGALTFHWSPEPPSGQGSAHVGGLCAGLWTVLIADANGCDTSITFTLDEPQPVAASAEVTESHCGVCDGTAQLHVSGGAAPFAFQWGPPLNSTTGDSAMTGLCAGVYTVTVTDAAGCSTVLAVPITDAEGEEVTVTDGLTGCPGSCDGTVSAAYTCAAGPCTVEWTDLQGNTLASGTDALSGLCAGSYLVAVTNGNGCVTVDTATVASPAPMAADISSTPASCAGLCDGSATIGINGGTGPFTITWSPEPGGGQGSTHATGLCAGSYQIHVQDQGGCDSTFSVLITAPAALAVDGTVTEVGCAGECNGAIALDAQGGSGSFTYTWLPAPGAGQGTATASGLCAGTYSVTVADAIGGCDTTLSFTLAEPQPLTLAGTATTSHCALCDGTAAVALSGGTLPVNVQWTGPGGPVGSGESLANLCAGIYLATATDGHGCTASQTVAVPDADGETIAAADGQTYCANACDGLVSVAYNCGSGPCTVSWFDASGTLLAQGQDSLGGLCPGTYLVQVLNGDGCLSMDTAAVVPSHTVLPNLSTTPVSCPGQCNGTATVNPAGGTAPYGYSWSPQPGGGQNSATATGLCAGTYQVTISDAAGCDTVVNVLITAPQPLAVDAQVGQVSCNGACDGSIVLSPSGGNGFFSYTWSPEPPNGPGSNGAFNLCAGDWTVTVADVNGCDTTLTFTITEPEPLAAAASSTQSDCGACNGTASVDPQGGTAPYTITWTQGGTVLGSGAGITGLCAGVYAVRVEDAHGCTAEQAVTVANPGGETLSAAGGTVSCPGQCDGTASVDFTCGEPACSVAWFDAGGNDLNEPGNTLAGLCAGQYFVQVTNGAGCVSIDTATVASPQPVQANLSTTPVSCAGDCDGTATVGPTGGAGGYDYSWDLGTGSAQGTPQVVGLCPGTYSVTITDLAGCSITQDVLITAPGPITAGAVVTPITCNGANDGSITVIAQGGTGSLQYQWSPPPPAGQGTNSASGLGAGNWTVAIVDANGCDTSFTLTLTDPPVLSATIDHTDNLCYNDCAATAEVDITGGVAPYAITWTAADGTVVNQDSTAVAGLCAGDYAMQVADARGCTVTLPFTIAAGVPIAADLSTLGESCNGPCDGSAAVAASGGTGSGYSYLWQPGNPAGQGTGQVSGLCPGTWSVTITDGGGCDSTFAFTIDPFQPIVPVATVQQVACNGACNGSISLAVTGGSGALSYAWTPEPGTGQGTADAGGLCPGSYAVTITDAAGCDTTVEFSITEPPAITVAVDAVTDASCSTAADGAISVTVTGGTPGLTLSWSGPGGFASNAEDLSGLLPGTYSLTVTDQNGCALTVPVDVGSANAVEALAGGDQTICSGVAVVLDGSASQGASVYQWTDLQGNAAGSGPVVDLGPLPDGSHVFILTAADGPCTDADTVTITVLPLPVADAGQDQVIYVQGTVVLGGDPAGPPGSSFIWQPDSVLDHADIPNPNATLHATSWFTLTVIGPDGCTATDSVLITVVPEVKVPSGFTPNGDGHNDTWVLDFAGLFPDLEVQVFSRWGEPLFRSEGYRVPWDGKYNGKVVPMGTYYYVIELHDPRFPEALTGPLTVIR